MISLTKNPNNSLNFSVYFTIETDEETPTVSGGPLTGPYQFNQLHYHWGDNDSYGSEGNLIRIQLNYPRLSCFFNRLLLIIKDSLNGKHYPMELHVVSFRKEYKSMKEATSKADGLVVMA